MPFKINISNSKQAVQNRALLAQISIIFVLFANIANAQTHPNYRQDFQQIQTRAHHEPEKHHHAKDEHIDYYSYPKYSYNYGVEDEKTGDYKTHKEERDGDVVKGEYTVADPDGTYRTVTYTVTKHSGFQAVVTKSGGADHKEHEVEESKSQYKQKYSPQQHKYEHFEEYHKSKDQGVPVVKKYVETQKFYRPKFEGKQAFSAKKSVDSEKDVGQKFHHLAPEYFLKEQEVKPIDHYYQHKTRRNFANSKKHSEHNNEYLGMKETGDEGKAVKVFPAKQSESTFKYFTPNSFVHKKTQVVPSLKKPEHKLEEKFEYSVPKFVEHQNAKKTVVLKKPADKPAEQFEHFVQKFRQYHTETQNSPSKKVVPTLKKPEHEFEYFTPKSPNFPQSQKSPAKTTFPTLKKPVEPEQKYEYFAPEFLDYQVDEPKSPAKKIAPTLKKAAEKPEQTYEYFGPDILEQFYGQVKNHESKKVEKNFEDDESDNIEKIYKQHKYFTPEFQY